MKRLVINGTNIGDKLDGIGVYTLSLLRVIKIKSSRGPAYYS
jgi:hypothetical protein